MKSSIIMKIKRVRRSGVRNRIVLELNGVTEKCMLHDPKQGENNWIIDCDIPIFKGDGREYIEQFVNVG